MQTIVPDVSSKSMVIADDPVRLLPESVEEGGDADSVAVTIAPAESEEAKEEVVVDNSAVKKAVKSLTKEIRNVTAVVEEDRARLAEERRVREEEATRQTAIDRSSRRVVRVPDMARGFSALDDRTARAVMAGSRMRRANHSFDAVTNRSGYGARIARRSDTAHAPAARAPRHTVLHSVSTRHGSIGRPIDRRDALSHIHTHTSRAVSEHEDEGASVAASVHVPPMHGEDETVRIEANEPTCRPVQGVEETVDESGAPVYKSRTFVLCKDAGGEETAVVLN